MYNTPYTTKPCYNRHITKQRNQMTELQRKINTLDNMIDFHLKQGYPANSKLISIMIDKRDRYEIANHLNKLFNK